MSASFDLDALERLAAERLDVENDCDLGDGGVPCQQCVDEREMAVGVAALVRAVKALERIADQQPKTLAMIERNGFVFTDIGCEPGNWQHLAFTVYTDLCEVDTIARAALAPFAPETGEAA